MRTGTQPEAPEHNENSQRTPKTDWTSSAGGLLKLDISELPEPQTRSPKTLNDLLELRNIEATEPALKRLRREIHKKERELAVQLIYRPRNGGPYRLRASALREHMPELWPTQDLRGPVTQLFRRMGQDMEDMDRDVEDIKGRQEGTDLKLLELEARDDILMDEIKALKKQLSQLTATDRHVSTISVGQDSKSQPT